MRGRENSVLLFYFLPLFVVRLSVARFHRAIEVFQKILATVSFTTHTHIVVVVIILIIIIMAPRTPSSVHPPANDDVNERAVRKVELSKFHLQFEAEMRNSEMRNIEMNKLRHQERMKERDIEHARKLKEDLDWHEQNMKKDRSEKEQKMELEREMLKLKREQLEFEREQLAFELERDRKRSKTN